MRAFAYARPKSLAEASAAATADGAVVKAGGSDLLDRMKERIDEPARLVDLLRVGDDGFREIAVTEDGTITIGAGVTLAEIAAHDGVRRIAPTVGQAAERAASPQIRHRATIAGNLCQHTRCGYYRHGSFPCLKRGDDACPVLADGAVQDVAGVFGNTKCASAHPSSLAPALASLWAKVTIRGTDEALRVVDLDALYRAPEQGVAGDTVLAAGELITAVTLRVPDDPNSKDHAAYEGVRHKEAFDWPLVSAAVWYRKAPGKHGEGLLVTSARIRLGSVAPTPHAARAAEQALVGTKATAADIAKAAQAATEAATALPGNQYKLQLIEVAVRRALTRASENGK